MVSNKIKTEQDAKSAVRTALFLMKMYGPYSVSAANDVVRDIIRWLEHYARGQKHLVVLRAEAPDEWKGFIPQQPRV